MRSLAVSGGARLLGFVPQAIATLVASHLIIQHYGLHAFDTYALIISVMTLIPLNNLGVGASVTQAIAANGADDEHSERTALTAARVLSISALFLAVVSFGFGAAGLWPKLLGDASGANAFTAAALVIYGLGFVPGLGQSVLLGVDRNHVTITVLAFQAPVSLAMVVIMLAVGLDGRWVIVVPSLTLLVLNLVTMEISSRMTSFPWRRILSEVPWRRRYPGGSIRSLSGSMLITSICVPIAFAGDRIVLSHVSTASAVANYSVVLQLFSPVLGLIVAAAQPLWPMFTKARTAGERGPGLAKIFLAFGVATLAVSAVLVVIANPVGTLIGGSKIHLGVFLPVMAALVMSAQAVTYPLAMSLVDPAGARFVAGCAILAVPANIGTSIWLSRELGAPGPLVSLLVVSTVVQVIPTLIYSRRRERLAIPIATM